MWVKKYRPRQLDEIAGQAEVVKQLKGFVKEKTLPNLLLWGPKGSGKTSLVYAVARGLYGDDASLLNLLHIECSDFVEQRKKWLKEEKRFRFFYDEQKSAIDIFKAVVREYAVLSPVSANASFKLLFFSSADLLPLNLQQALRRVMERSNKTCRFIFATSKPAGVVPAVRSRCLNLHFTALDKTGALEALLAEIAEAEGLKLTAGALKTLKQFARGDAGAGINILEAAAAAAAAAEAKTIGEGRIKEVVQNAFLQRKKAEELLDSAFGGRRKKVREGLEALIKDERVGAKEVLAEVHEALRRRLAREGQGEEERGEEERGEEERGEEEARWFAKLVLHEAEADFKLCNSLNPIIHLEELLAHFLF